MTINLFHGSKDIIEKPLYGCGKRFNDYGLGFYCTKSLDMAMEWSVSLQRDGYANSYILDINDLSILNLNSERFCILHWLTVLLQNRTFDLSGALAAEARDYLLRFFNVDYSNYDVIIGYRADDSYFSFAEDFLNGAISYRQLCSAMRLGNLGEQIVLKSENAFSKISFTGSEFADHRIWYPRKALRDRVARETYFDATRNSRKKGDIFITHILDEEIVAVDPRLQ